MVLRSSRGAALVAVPEKGVVSFALYTLDDGLRSAGTFGPAGTPRASCTVGGAAATLAVMAEVRHEALVGP